ncbi:helix-turn-helix domain-containing protein [Deinococcus sp. QL22]|uniref:helix-turn-helix domain-containing protein n=1 Tax=Deinococcus sp. QL22 TaxID=2939437 RepID=UPI002016D365|nr:helix-turn-helix transcriptional regulator [Deinococcus sp. QL22]UQN06803.1 helix-turn-helix domain-containing protein [Deinococcus sp. QL22]
MRIQVGQNIRAARERCGLDQRELAEKMFGKAERSSYISDVESGKAGNVTVERLAEFATALNCQPYDLLLTTNSKVGAA